MNRRTSVEEPDPRGAPYHLGLAQHSWSSVEFLGAPADALTSVFFFFWGGSVISDYASHIASVEVILNLGPTLASRDWPSTAAIFVRRVS